MNGVEKSGVQLVIEGVRDFVDGLNRSREAYTNFTGAIGKTPDTVSLGKWAASAFGESDLGGTLGSLISSAFAGFTVGGAPGAAIGAILQLVTTEFGNVSRAADTFKGVVGNVVNAVTNLGKAILSGAVSALKSLLGVLGSVAKGILSIPLGILQKFGDMLKRIGEIALGVLVRDAIRAVLSGIKDMAAAALDAAANFQTLQIRLEGLLAREIAKGTTIQQVTTSIIALTDAEKLRLIELQEGYQGLQQEVDATAKAYDEMVRKHGENSKQALELSVQLTDLQNQLYTTESAIGALSGAGGKLVTTMTEITEGSMSFSDAMNIARTKAQELLKWVQIIAVTTPFDIQTITNTVTLASSYGLATDQAKALTTAIVDFTSGMGLNDDAMRKIIENFGQMIQQGKITGTELRDLGRGAFVPVNDLLMMTAERLGMVGYESGVTAAKLNAFAREKGLDPVVTMMEAFIDLTGEQFPGAAERMSQTLVGVKNNAKDFIDVMLGAKVIKPTLDKLTEGASDFIQALVSDTRLQATLDVIGTDLATIVENIIGNGPSVEEIISRINDILLKVSNAISWIARGDFERAMKALGIKQEVIDKIFKFAETIKNLKDRFLEFVAAFKEGGWQAALASLGVPGSTILGIENLKKAMENLKDFWDKDGARIIGAILESVGKLFGMTVGQLDFTGPVENANIKSKKGMGPGDGGGFLKLSQDIKRFTEELDADAIIEKIGSITESIIGFIEDVAGFLETVNKVWETTAGIFSTVLKFVAIIGGVFGTQLWTTSESARVFKDTVSGIFDTLKNNLTGEGGIVPTTLDLIVTAFETAFDTIQNSTIGPFVDWALEQIGILMDAYLEFINLLSGKIWGTGGTGGAGNQSAMPSYVQGGAGTTVNNTTNVSVTANYAKTQAPLTVAQDIQAILGAVGRP